MFHFLLVSVFVTVDANIEVVAGTKGTATFKFKDPTDNKIYTETFDTKTQKNIQIDRQLFTFEAPIELWFAENYFIGQPTDAMLEDIKMALEDRVINYIRIGDHFVSHPKFPGQKQESSSTIKLFSPAKIEDTKDGAKIIFTTLVPKNPKTYRHPWQQNGIFTIEQWPFNAENAHFSSLRCGEEDEDYFFKYNSKNKLWYGKAGTCNTATMQTLINDRFQYAGLFLKEKNNQQLYGIVQARGGITQLPVESQTPLVLDAKYANLDAIGLRDPSMIFDFWHPMLPQKPEGHDPTYTDDVYWSKVRIDQLQDCVFAKNSEYAYLIVHSQPKFVRFLQEKRDVDGEFVLLHDEMQNFKFGHASMLTGDEYRQTNEFTIKKVFIQQNQKFNAPRLEYHTAKYKLVKAAGSFITGNNGKIVYISNDSGHFPVERSAVPIIVKQMKFREPRPEVQIFDKHMVMRRLHMKRKSIIFH